MARAEIPGNPERERHRERAREVPRRTPRELPARDGLPLPARRRGEEVAAQIHRAGELPLEEIPTREECWDMLGPDVRARLQAKAGTILEWWARLDHTGRPRAVVLGPGGLCKANPVDRHGKRAHLIERLQLEPGAMRRRSFDSSRTPPGAPAASRAPGGGGPPRGPLPTVDLGLNAETRDVLGNLPADVQDFLQRPFLHGDSRGVVADWDYQEVTEFTHRRLSVLFVLSADRNVTFASGLRILPRGRSPRDAHWEVECYHAPVRGRGGP
ncbi:hypothetical protein [Streptomyces sp. 184]|uniref:hypothetical protein n=1 Tax=Streptomyces sp. 184 TaxID=1827526 RepID=UPI00389123DA